MAPKASPSKQKGSLVVIDTDSDDETTTPTMPDGEDYESWLDELRSVRPYTSSYTPRTIANGNTTGAATKLGAAGRIRTVATAA